ncbi:MAG: hypothetical protein ABSH04_07255 [Acidimicrobiales bacterium]
MASRRRLRRREEPRRTRLSHWRADGQAKVRYPSEAEANRAAFGYRLEHGSDLPPYRCEFCGGWHLGGTA